MSPTQRAAALGSFWAIGIGALAVPLAPYEPTWNAHSIFPRILIAPLVDTGWSLLVWSIAALITIAVPAIGGSMCGAAVASRVSPEPDTPFGYHLGLDVAAIVSIVVGWCAVILSKFTIFGPVPTTRTDATYAFVVWTLYVAVAYTVARLIRRRRARTATTD
ncbi:hypothetical protein ACFVDI_27990 [Nocardioides sp. NPDC057767]|uniref:hypothetical protein n=1 Tax=unclassified Nocardioides TaxID=2615069 RepID=UPI00366D1F69